MTTKTDTADLSPMEKARAKAKAPAASPKAPAAGETPVQAAPKAVAKPAGKDATASTVKPKADASREAQLKAATGLVRREQNGIKEPSAGGLCAKAWTACDATMADLGRTPSLKEVLAGKHVAGLNETNVRVEYYPWRKFHGHQPVVIEAAVAPNEAAPDA